jgi:hypothetical protein
MRERVRVIDVWGIGAFIRYIASSHDKTDFNLERGSDILYILSARVRIWVISAVAAPNIHSSCKSCSSRTKPSVAATTISRCFWMLSYALICEGGLPSYHTRIIYPVWTRVSLYIWGSHLRVRILTTHCMCTHCIKLSVYVLRRGEWHLLTLTPYMKWVHLTHAASCVLTSPCALVAHMGLMLYIRLLYAT